MLEAQRSKTKPHPIPSHPRGTSNGVRGTSGCSSDRTEVLPAIRTSPPNARRVRMLAKVLRDCLRGARFSTLSDLMDAWKTQLARLRLAYTNDDLNAAMTMLESNRPLVHEPRARQLVERAPDPDVRPLSREEAADLARRLKAAVEREAKRRRGHGATDSDHTGA